MSSIIKKKLKKASSQKPSDIFQFEIKIIQIEYTKPKIFFTLFPIFKEYVKEYLYSRKNSSNIVNMLHNKNNI